MDRYAHSTLCCRPAGYDNYTTSMVHSLAKVNEGYFEIRWRSGQSDNSVTHTLPTENLLEDTDG